MPSNSLDINIDLDKNKQSSSNILTFLKFFDGLVDSLYLNESLLAYCQDVTGSDVSSGDWFDNHYEFLGLYAFSSLCFLFAGIAKGYSNAFSDDWKNKKDLIKERYMLFRDFFSGLKNGRHAVINIFSCIKIISNKSFNFSLFNSSCIVSAGVLGFSVGCLLAYSNWKRSDLLNKRKNRKNLANNILLLKQYSQDLEIEPFPSFFCENDVDDECEDVEDKNSEKDIYLGLDLSNNNSELMLREAFHSLTDGLYQVGNIYMLLGLFGVGVSGPAAWGLLSAYCIYTSALVFSNCCKEKSEQIEEEILVAKALGDDKLLAQAEEKKIEWEKSYKFSLHKKIDYPLGIIRKNINYFKNSIAAVAGMFLLSFSSSLVDLKEDNAVRNIGVIIASSMVMKSCLNYLFKNKKKDNFSCLFWSNKNNNINLADNSYDAPLC